MLLGDYSNMGKTGRHRLLEIEQVKNGWLVTYYPVLEKPNSAKFQEAQKIHLEKQKLEDKDRLARHLKEQAAAMKVAGDAMMKSKENWNDDVDDLNFDKIDELVEKISSESSPVPDWIPANAWTPLPEPESLIFTSKDELLKFLVQCI